MLWTSKGPLYVPIMIFEMTNTVEDCGRPEKQLFSLFNFSPFLEFLWKMPIFAPFFQQEGKKRYKRVGFRAQKHNRFIAPWTRVTHAEFDLLWCKNESPVQYFVSVHAKTQVLWPHFGPLLHFFGSFGVMFLVFWGYFWSRREVQKHFWNLLLL